jgi:hypothetical protein
VKSPDLGAACRRPINKEDANHQHGHSPRHQPKETAKREGISTVFAAKKERSLMVADSLSFLVLMTLI